MPKENNPSEEGAPFLLIHDSSFSASGHDVLLDVLLLAAAEPSCSGFVCRCCAWIGAQRENKRTAGCRCRTQAILIILIIIDIMCGECSAVLLFMCCCFWKFGWRRDQSEKRRCCCFFSCA
jgi:hypothetical protein